MSTLSTIQLTVHIQAYQCSQGRKVIRKADIQFGRLDWEFESGERAIDVDEAVLRPVTDPFTGKKRAEMPKLNERLFRGVNVSAGTSGDFITSSHRS